MRASLSGVPAVSERCTSGRASGSALSASFLHLPPRPPTPTRAARTAAHLTFQTGQLQPHGGTGAGLRREQRLVCIGHVGPAPTLGPDGCTTGSSGERDGASRSRRLLTTSGLNLLKAESVLAEKTFRHLRAKYTGGRLRSGVKLAVRAWSGADEAEPTPPGLSF